MLKRSYLLKKDTVNNNPTVDAKINVMFCKIKYSNHHILFFTWKILQFSSSIKISLIDPVNW